MSAGKSPASGVVSEWRDGWKLVLAAAAGMFVSAIAVYSAGVFILPLEHAYGWSRAEISGGLTVLNVVAVFGAPAIGVFVDKYGPRRIALPGTLLYLAAFALLGLAGPSIWSWYAIWGVISIASLGTKPNVYTAAVASRFDRNRGLALGVSLLGVGIALSIAPPATEFFIERYGVRIAFLLVAAATAIITVPILWRYFYGAFELTVLGTPAVRLPGHDVRPALLSVNFVQLATASLAVSTAMTAVAVHMVPMLVEKGLSIGAAATAAGAMGVSSLFGRLLSGLMMDRLPARLVSAAVFTLPIAAFALALVNNGSMASSILIATIFGFALGGEIDILAYMTSRAFGMRNFGTIFGLISGLLALGAGIGPLAAGAIYDAQKSYDMLLYMAMPVMAVSAIAIATLGLWQRGESGPTGGGKIE